MAKDKKEKRVKYELRGILPEGVVTNDDDAKALLGRLREALAPIATVERLAVRLPATSVEL